MNPKIMKIFEPLTINGMELKNRIALGPFGNHPAGLDGNPNYKTLRCYEPMAKGGFGMIMLGITQITQKKTDWIRKGNDPEDGCGLLYLDEDWVRPYSFTYMREAWDR